MVAIRTGDSGMVSEPAATATDGSGAAKRGRGRPRLASTDDSILRATLELLRAGGPGQVTIDAVAANSGSAKSTIYRRWPSLDDLIVDALRVAFRGRPDQVDEIHEFDRLHGSPVRGAARQALSLVREPLFQSSFPTMVRILLGDPSLARRFRAQVFAPLRTIRRNELLDMIATGAIRPGVDPDLVLDLINGAVLYRSLMAEPLDEAVVDQIADLICRSIEPRVAGSSD
jgi:AcrR family transcriptional regulator